MLTPGLRIGPYEVIAKLGEGGMGEVFRGRDTRLRRDVALKVLPQAALDDDDRRSRLEREAQVLASLNHPNIAQVFGVEDAAGTPVIVMELVEGDTLADRLVAGALPIREALLAALQLCDGLEAAHDRGVVHRDLKPANIKLRPDGSIKILDFGLAKALAQGSGTSDSPTMASPGVTNAGIVLGTAAYMSPEQARGKVVDKRADIWAFGCVLYEMLSGAAAFPGETTTDILAAVVQREPDWTRLPSALPPGSASCCTVASRRTSRTVSAISAMPGLPSSARFGRRPRPTNGRQRPRWPRRVLSVAAPPSFSRFSADLPRRRHCLE